MYFQTNLKFVQYIFKMISNFCYKVSNFAKNFIDFFCKIILNIFELILIYLQ